MMACLDWKIKIRALLVLFVTFCAVPFSRGYTYGGDVYAINQLYISLGFPPIPYWVDMGGDPCGPPEWPGVTCVLTRISNITLAGRNLGGNLTDELAMFTAILQLDLSNNQIGGTIPSQLPVTLMSLSLSDNQFTGPIPDTISSLTSLMDLSLSNNHLTGPIPDSFEPLARVLTTLDLSSNNLSSVLPASMASSLSLESLNLQNNQLSGVLDVLTDLHLKNLNIENNLFSGPIPASLLSIPNFRRDGNPFNTTPIASPPVVAPPLSPSSGPSLPPASSDRLHGPSASPVQQTRMNDGSPKKSHATLFLTIGLVVVILLILGLCLYVCSCCKRKRISEKADKNHDIETYGVLRNSNKQEQAPKSRLYPVQKGMQAPSNEVPPAGGSGQLKTAFLKPRNNHSIDMTGSNSSESLSGRIPLPLLPAERITADPIFSSLTSRGNEFKLVNTSKLYTIASLQEYTNSFAQGNLIGNGILGSVYRGQAPDGRVLAIKKLDKLASGHLSDAEFLELVSRISKLHDPNIVELVGYCLEHGQRLLVYNYCRNGTLNEALHLDEEMKKKLSWNARMLLALQAAKSLEYLHETCNPPVVHRNFKSANVLLEDDFSVRVSDCGLAPLLSSDSLAQLQGTGYGAPELELGSYSCQSDVYSFGVVMLELLTGRRSYDRSRPRGEQYLVRWAFSRLHDIDALSRMVDPTLKGSYPSKSLSRLADIISLCIQAEPEFRPPVSEIVQKLLHMIQRDQ